MSKRHFTDAALIESLPKARTVAELGRLLGISKSSAYQTLPRHVRRLGLDTSHLANGQGWAKGRTNPQKVKATLEKLLNRGTRAKSHDVRLKLVRFGLKTNTCESCGLDEWCGQPLSLHLDHINGDHSDNRLENLRILCPNCHSQTPTYGNKKRVPPPGLEPGVSRF